jgi:hypothetical protein
MKFILDEPREASLVSLQCLRHCVLIKLIYLFSRSIWYWCLWGDSSLWSRGSEFTYHCKWSKKTFTAVFDEMRLSRKSEPSLYIAIENRQSIVNVMSCLIVLHDWQLAFATYKLGFNFVDSCRKHVYFIPTVYKDYICNKLFDFFGSFSFHKTFIPFDFFNSHLFLLLLIFVLCTVRSFLTARI